MFCFVFPQLKLVPLSNGNRLQLAHIFITSNLHLLTPIFITWGLILSKKTLLLTRAGQVQIYEAQTPILFKGNISTLKLFLSLTENSLSLELTPDLAEGLSTQTPSSASYEQFCKKVSFPTICIDSMNQPSLLLINPSSIGCSIVKQL